MRVASFSPNNFQDDERGLSSAIFLTGCNFKCPTCHSKPIVYGTGIDSSKRIIQKLRRKRAFIHKVVISGGEPTLQEELEKFVKEIKALDISIKLDTNGSNPEVLKRLLDQESIDYLAMDVKAPEERYSDVIGINGFNTDPIEESMRITQKFPNYEFRTTVVPIIRGYDNNGNPDISMMTIEEAENMAKWIIDTTKNKENPEEDKEHTYWLQPFIARSENEIINPRFAKENLSKELQETPRELLEQMREVIKAYLPNCEIRGKP